jgi:hypothetical protein
VGSYSSSIIILPIDNTVSSHLCVVGSGIVTAYFSQESPREYDPGGEWMGVWR